MNKLIPLAVAIAVFPLTQREAGSDLSFSFFKTGPVKLFPYKNTITTDPFAPEKKIAKPWTENWMADAKENIRKSEYHFKWEEKLKAYCTPNRKNNLRFFYTDKGFSVEPRTTKIPIGEFDPTKRLDEIKYRSIPNWKVKFDLDNKQVGSRLLSGGKWQIANNRAEYIASNITVQYLNSDEGMRQNFIVRKPFSKAGELKINFRVKTKLTVCRHGNQLQFFHKKTNVLNYRDLKVWDANHRSLTACFQKNRNGAYSIRVNTKDAVYPITIDPISTIPDAVAESNQVGAQLGVSVASAGDVNGDGYSDVVAGAFLYDNGELNEGAAFVYHGSAAGISTTPASIAESNQAGASMGYSVATAGDVNGDGYSDIIAGAYLYTNGQSFEGAAYVFHGTPSGINTSPAVILESNQASAGMGISVSSAGDVNGDGYSDVIVGAYAYDNGETDEGVAFVYHGSASGINATPAALLESNQATSLFGRSVASAGDVNGDGYSDVIVGALNYDNGEADEGAAFIFYGSASGINTTPAALLESNQASSWFSYSVASAGDVNGDGYSDVIVGANDFDNGQTNEGVAFIYHGSSTGINTSPTAMLESNQISAEMGIVSSAGDVNGDGYADVIVGAYFYDNGETNEGAVFVYSGSASGINSIPIAMMESNQANAGMGFDVSSAGDVNGDGYSDVVAGAYGYANGQSQEGAAFVFHGSAAGVSTVPNSIREDADQGQAWFGYSVANAGDVNGDGYSDVIIGAWGYSDGINNGEGRAFVYHGSPTGISAIPNSTPDDADQADAWFGYSVAGAGDVNGDGYSDVIIGAFNYSDGIYNSEGRAFVYHGSAAGLSASPNNTPDDADQANAQFGNCVASAGDVNGDGYADVIIGAYTYKDGTNNAEGRAFVYHGSSIGLSATPNSTPDDADQANVLFGNSVASAGDVNGDGYSDVIIGADGYNDGGNTDEGRAFVYYGSFTGLSAAPNGVLDDADQAFSGFGASVAGAGDVNGDGYSDVIVGALTFDDIGNDEGRAFVYYGSSTGLSATPDSTPDDADQSGCYFGQSVACAGDVNGDGYSDVIIGAGGYDVGPNINAGGAFIYYGSAAGLSASPATILSDSNEFGAFFGKSAACAGDVNGDGYSDVIAGAYVNGGNIGQEGRTFVYHGNISGNNIRNNLRLYNADLVTPINRFNFAFANFGAGLFGKSFLGRSKGKMVWETRLNFNPWSGTPITNSTLYTSQQISYTDMGLAGIELKNLVNKLTGASRYTKLRARIKYDPVTAITGQVYSPWRYVSSIIDANNLGVLPIELVSFNASWQQKGRSAKLEFRTDKESGICCFDIEKSIDGFNFSSIGSLPAKNIPGIQTYSFIDNNATNNKQFYRIKIKGVGGQVEYSNIQQLSAGPGGQNNSSTEILVFPNPTADVLQLQLNSTYSKMDVQLFNAAGQIIKQLNHLTPSNQTLAIPVRELSPGHYWLKLQSGGEKQVLQFVKE